MEVSDKAKTYKRIKEMLKEAKNQKVFWIMQKQIHDSSTSEGNNREGHKIIRQRSNRCCIFFEKRKNE